MESQFGLVSVWTQGDWVTKGVALLLLAMSLASWMVILIKALDILKYKKLAAGTEAFWHSADFAEGLARLGPQAGNPFHALAVEGREAAQPFPVAPPIDAINAALVDDIFYNPFNP